MKRQKRKSISDYVPSQMSSRKKTFKELEKSLMNQETTFESETTHLTNNDTFFPELVWKIIAKRLKSPEDIENCSNSGYFFNKLLSNKRETEIVLPKVFEILAEKYAKSEDTSYKETNLQSISWNRLEGEPIHKMTGLWKCRLVCKAWCKAIDDLHQQMDVGHHFNVCTETQAPAPKNSHLLQYAKYTFILRKMDRFLKNFRLTHYKVANQIVTKNPFLGRSVVFQLIPTSTNVMFVEYRNGIGEILEKWGKEIWYCTLNHLRFQSGHEIEFYRLLRQSLISMPNLRALHISYNLAVRSSVIPDCKTLESEISENPLPTLPNLMNFSAVNLPGPILDHFISRNNIPYGNICVRNDFYE